MNVLITGRGGSGSWQIRAVQIGDALKAQVKPYASAQDCAWADVIVAVKRVPDDLLKVIRKSGKPWVYDIVDAYPQKECWQWSRDESIAWVHKHLAHLEPNHVIWPNRRMMEDCGNGTVIYHHARPKQPKNPIRERFVTVGYEGAPAYIAAWQPILEAECQKRGLVWQPNPGPLDMLDAVVALRGPKHNGYPQQHWKSNVKLANAHGTGTPFIGHPEDGYLETQTGKEYFVTTREQLGMALDWLEPHYVRHAISRAFLDSARTLKQAASEYAELLRCVAKS